MRRIINAGFSLIELMIVVSIIGILAVIAIPSYQNYTQRARFSEIIQATQPYKTAVALALQQGIPLTELALNKHGIPAAPIATTHLAAMKIKNGVITAIATPLIEETTYVLTPNSDGTRWTTSGSCLKNGLCHA